MYLAIIISILLFLLTSLLVAYIVVKLPKNYFVKEQKEQVKPLWGSKRALNQAIIMVIKNLIGVIIVVAGIMMIFMPGPGLVTILLGVVLLDFPGRRKLVQRLVKHATVLEALNGLRERFNKEPFVIKK